MLSATAARGDSSAYASPARWGGAVSATRTSDESSARPRGGTTGATTTALLGRARTDSSGSGNTSGRVGAAGSAPNSVDDASVSDSTSSVHINNSSSSSGGGGGGGGGGVGGGLRIPLGSRAAATGGTSASAALVRWLMSECD